MTSLPAKRPQGRPKARNPLNCQIYLRLTEADGQRLDALSDRLNRDRSDVLREIVLSGLKKMETGR